MSRYILILLLLILLFTIQTAVLPFLSIYNISPDVLLIFITGFSIINGQWDGMICGIVSGMMMDVFYSPIFGIYSIIYVTLGFFIGKISKNIFKENPYAALFFVLAGSIYKGIIIMTVKIMLSYNSDIWMSFLAITLPETILNGIIIFLTYGYLVRLNNLSLMKKNKTMF